MIKDLIHDPDVLATKSEKASAEDLPVAQDLLDTLMAHKGECVGMAANMIGVHKRIIAVEHEDSYIVMLNPKILAKSEPYKTEEGCLSLLGGPRPCKRYWRHCRWRRNWWRYRRRSWCRCRRCGVGYRVTCRLVAKHSARQYVHARRVL